MKFEIGSGVTCDVGKLVDTRLLVQANSGSGKSWLLRRLLEQTHGHVQHLVIDPEGEFASLRERFDYVLAAKHGGDTAADPRAATLLAERLLDLKVSAILDIYELKPHERIAFVARFLDALVNAPKNLWHPVLVVVDEAHVFAPEKGEAESASAVKDLATRGRKRGFCAVLATQRLSKLAKDAAAECNNKLIGRTTLDVDVKRAADELGVTDREALVILRSLEPGEFFAYGPALSGQPNEHGVLRTRTGAIETTHPKAGARLAFTAPPPTSKVKALLPKLADLPAEAEERVKSVETLKRDVAELRRELTIAKKAQPVGETKTVEKFVLKDGQLARAEKLVADIKAASDRHLAMVERFNELDERLGAAAHELAQAILQTRVPQRDAPTMKGTGVGQPRVRPVAPVRPASVPLSVEGNGDLSGPERKILRSLAELRALGLYPADKQQLGLLAGYTNIRSGGFSEPFSRLNSGGYLVSERGTVEITEAGAEAAGTVDPPESSEELQARILDKLTGPERRLLNVLLERYPDPMTKEELGQACGYTNIRSGGFSEPVSHLNVLGLIESHRGAVTASRALFLEGA